VDEFKCCKEGCNVGDGPRIYDTIKEAEMPRYFEKHKGTRLSKRGLKA
jgi:hypothetical protein